MGFAPREARVRTRKSRAGLALFLAGFSLLSLVLLAGEASRPVQIPVGSEQLTALYWEPPRSLSPAVLLLPMLGRGKEDWAPLATRLRQEGYAVLALELREQGRSNREHLLEDVRAGFEFLREQKKVDAARIGLVGADIGANAALCFAATEPLVRLVVLVSPGLNYRGLATEPALRDYGVRPLYLLAAEDDVSSATAVRRLAEAAPGHNLVGFYPGAAHGTDLLDEKRPLAEEIVVFLRPRL